MRVAVAERRHRDAAAEVEIAAAVRVMDVGALSLLEGEVGARVRRHDGGNHSALLEYTEPVPLGAPARKGRQVC